MQIFKLYLVGVEHAAAQHVLAEPLPDLAELRLRVAVVERRLLRVGLLDEHQRARDAERLVELAARDERDHGLGDLPYPPEHPKMAGEPKRVQPSKDASRHEEHDEKA